MNEEPWTLIFILTRKADLTREYGVQTQIYYGATGDPVKSIETIAHSARRQGSALVRYRLGAAQGWQGN